MQTDDYVNVRSDGKDEDLDEMIRMPEDNVRTPIDITKIVHELAEDVKACSLATAHDIGLVNKYETVKAVIFGTVALATGEMERRLAKLPDTPKVEAAEAITDLVKEASINQVIKASDALKAGLKLETRALEVAAVANAISKATEGPEEISQNKRWAFFPSFW